MIIRIFNCFFVLVIFALSFIMPFGHINEVNAGNPDDEVVLVPKKKIQELKGKRNEIENNMKKEIEKIKDTLPEKKDSPKIKLLESQMTTTIKNMDSLIKEADENLTIIEKTSDPGAKEVALNSLNNITNELQNVTGYYLGDKRGIKWGNVNLEHLENLVQSLQNAGDSLGKKQVLQKAWDNQFNEENMGGGVFANKVAQMPVNPKNIDKAEYDSSLGRFVLYEKDSGRKIFLPIMNADMTATIVKCINYGEKGRNEISESFNIDPVNLEMYKGKGSVAPYDSSYAVLFGCRHLWDTRVGKILIDSDHMLVCIMHGKNRLGRNISDDYGFHPLYHLMFDHPVMIDALSGSNNRTYDTRFWIAPDAVNLNLEGNNLEFENVSFRLFTETIRFASSQYYKGDYLPNPGADIFSNYFNDHFERFCGLVLRTDEQTGNPVRPLEELKDVAKISGVVLWIKENSITMDTSWVQTFPVGKVNTESAVDNFLFTKEDLERRMKFPITIYNQYGISRSIDATGTVEKYEYYESGQLKRKTRIENGQETILWELKEETAFAPGMPVLPSKDLIKIIVMGLIFLATVLIYIFINKKRKA